MPVHGEGYPPDTGYVLNVKRDHMTVRHSSLSFVPLLMAANVLLTVYAPPSGKAQSRLLDDFETLEGWKEIVSEGAKLHLIQSGGTTGRSLGMVFDLRGVYGYVIAQKEFAIDLPRNYQFTFDMRAEAPVNNFEFKLIDDQENVFWIKKMSYAYPGEWTRQRIKKRHLTFAWGPARGGEIRKVRKIEFVVSVSTGGAGTVYLDNFRFEPIDENAGKSARAEVEASSNASGRLPAIDAQATLLSGWRSAGGREQEWLTVRFHQLKEVGGLVIDWDSVDFATHYQVLLSDDSLVWSKAYTVTNGNGGRDYVPLTEGEGRFLKLLLFASGGNGRYGIRRMAFTPPQFSASPNDLFRALAADAPAGHFPKFLQNKQSYWTVIGVNGDTQEALMNEQGQIEADKLLFSLEPFLYVDGHLVTWNDVSTTPALSDGYLPVPSVTWRYKDEWVLTIEAVAGGVAGNSLLGVRYTVQRMKSGGPAKLFVAVRPFQVNPPWQFLNVEGGATRIDSIQYHEGFVRVDGREIIPMTPPSRFGAAEFDQGHITDYLAQGTVPQVQNVHDHTGYASAALEYDLSLSAGEVKEICLAVPFHGWRGSPTPNMQQYGDQIYYSMMLSQTLNFWRGKLDRIRIALPASAQNVVNTLKSNLAYILINRDGPGIQPGSRNYERSWIRDGSLTCSALLRTGNRAEVREFIDWYAQGQFPNGKIPCVIDARGPDAVPEHDSHGEFIYAVLQYFLFTKDTLWLRGKFDNIVKTVRYIQSLRAERKTDVYKNGTALQRALYGLVPESISHEGYWDVPRHSYWDDFFVLRGLKDAATIARVLGEKVYAAEFAAERDDFRTDLYASMRLAMKNTGVDYIPGCAELGDFDATSTTIGVVPGGELGNIPEPQLHNTFDKYFRYFVERKGKDDIVNYTPYETRVIGTFVHLGQKQRAEEALAFFMNDRRPPAWNHWAEVVWRDPLTPKFIGDMPHTWVGSDFMRSVFSMFIYEREQDSAVVLGAGIPDRWVNDPAGVTVKDLPTYDGSVSYSIKRSGASVQVNISGTVPVPRTKLVLKSPLAQSPRSVRLNGRRIPVPRAGEIVLTALPVNVEFTY